jgi:hypothetical protein
MVNAKPPLLMLHVTSKHPDVSDPSICFPSLKGYDEEGTENGGASALLSGGGAVKPKKTKKKDENLDSLLDAGLKKSTKKK